ncbi:MAG: aminotransferase class III-fold pyridoxal phosphate-dependent enzyme, partial [Candidatus Omnitrophica bacterium]|nr:aminotransferase class III-fold pyridoxal phosphate-dependent enzyme [Candidatus Omnitrophota bacterium]
IRHLSQCLSMIGKHPHVGNVRQCGFMTGIELIQNRKTGKDYPIEKKMGAQVAMKAREYGVIIRPLGNVVVMMPSFSFTEKQITHLCQATYQAIDAVTQAS